MRRVKICRTHVAKRSVETANIGLDHVIKRIPEEIPGIPTFGHDELDRPRFDQLKPATRDARLFAFRGCHS